MLHVEEISKAFGPVNAVRALSFSVAPASAFGLLGPNGAGKTTTMRMILGIYLPDGGRISWNGARVDDRVRRLFGYLPEERGLYGKMPVGEQIAYFAKLHGLGRADAARRAADWIDRLGIGEYAKRPSGELSKGNQQKVQIACAAVHDPQLLVLDEPFSGLDPINADVLHDVLLDLRKRGTTLILSSHQMWQIERLCERFCIINRGTSVAQGTLAELRDAWPVRVVRAGPVSEPLRAVLERIAGARNLGTERGALAYEVPAQTDLAKVLREAVDAAEVAHFERIEPSLHEIYVRLVGSPA